MGQGNISGVRSDWSRLLQRAAFEIMAAWHRFQCRHADSYPDPVHDRKKWTGPLMQTVDKGLTQNQPQIPATRLENAASGAELEPKLFSRSTFMERLKAPNLSPASESAPADHQQFGIVCWCKSEHKFPSLQGYCIIAASLLQKCKSQADISLLQVQRLYKAQPSLQQP